MLKRDPEKTQKREESKIVMKWKRITKRKKCDKMHQVLKTYSRTLGLIHHPHSHCLVKIVTLEVRAHPEFECLDFHN